LFNLHDHGFHSKLDNSNLEANQKWIPLFTVQRFSGFLPVLLSSPRENDLDSSFISDPLVSNGSLHGLLVLASFDIQHVTVACEGSAACALHRIIGCLFPIG
jgi:hypothetical protein